MKGSNSLVLNTATMIEAMQYWMNSQMICPPVVVGVAHERENSCDVFKISLEEKDTDTCSS
ncbi:MAG: hypothetical protein ACYC1K_03445 [Minisyncoccota bacterium]